MSLPSVFVFHEKVTDGILSLLKRTTLGAQGARYQHLDTEQRIHQLDNPLFLSVERTEKVLGNITFCRRGKQWYIRYFAFDSLLQTNQKTDKIRNKNSTFKRALDQFFTYKLDPSKVDSIESFYAYIDPKNSRSMRMATQFGFKPIGSLCTQTFSRRKPKQKLNLHCSNDLAFQSKFLRTHFSSNHFYYEHATEEQPSYYTKNETGEITAFAKITRVNWRIERLPGKLGGVLVRIFPYLPFLNQLFRPKNHQFIVVEGLWFKNENPTYIQAFLESILAQEEKNLLIWWVDENLPLYQYVHKQVQWGPLHHLMGVQKVSVMQRGNQSIKETSFYVAGMDLV